MNRTSVPRRCASYLLDIVARHTSSDARDWANAMRGELDAIDGDWSALSWAVGSLTSLVRHFGRRELVAHMRQRFAPTSHEQSPRGLGMVTAEMLSGVALAGGVLVIGVLSALIVLHVSWSQFAHGSLTDRSLLVAAIEGVCISSAITVARRRRPLAAGIMLGGLTLLIHFASYGWSNRP